MTGPKTKQVVGWECASCGVFVETKTPWSDDYPEGYFVTVRRVTEAQIHSETDTLYLHTKDCLIDFVTYGISNNAEMLRPIARPEHSKRRSDRAIRVYGTVTETQARLTALDEHVNAQPTEAIPLDPEMPPNGVPGIYRSRLCLEQPELSGDKPEPMVLVEEDDKSWCFWIPETYPTRDWHGDRRWFNKEGATFTRTARACGYLMRVELLQMMFDLAAAKMGRRRVLPSTPKDAPEQRWLQWMIWCNAEINHEQGWARFPGLRAPGTVEP